jgi:N-acetylglutamate synthase-like GNAT family acetyltransferase
MSGPTCRVSRVGRDARELAGVLETDEPRTTPLVGDLLTYRGRRWRRAWRVSGPDGQLAGVLVLTRMCFDRWSAVAYLRDPIAAAPIARLLDRSVAWSVGGAAADIQPLLPYLRRARRVLVAPWIVADHPVADLFGPPDEHTRVATALDLDQLVVLYSGYELSWPMTRWQLRQYVHRALDDHLVVVYETAGRIVGAVVIRGRTRRYAAMMDLTVHPDFRRSGISWELAKRMREIGRGMAIGGWAALAASNPMQLHDDRIRWGDEHYYNVYLGWPRRFKGQTRLRRLYGRVQPLTARVPTNIRDPGDPGRPPSAG